MAKRLLRIPWGLLTLHQMNVIYVMQWYIYAFIRPVQVSVPRYKYLKVSVSRIFFWEHLYLDTFLLRASVFRYFFLRVSVSRYFFLESRYFFWEYLYLYTFFWEHLKSILYLDTFRKYLEQVWHSWKSTLSRRTYTCHCSNKQKKPKRTKTNGQEGD